MNRLVNVRKLAAVAAAVLLVGCAESAQDPVGLDDPFFAVGDRDNGIEDYTPGLARVCVFYPDGGTYGASTFSASAAAGDVVAGTFDIQGPPVEPHCYEAWNALDATFTDFTATLESTPAGLALERIVTFRSVLGADPVVNNLTGVTSGTVNVSDIVNGMVWFKFTPDDTPPPPGGEGCTPGYWRQDQHFDNWTGYAPSDLFSSVFDDYFPGQTLLDVVWAKGGGLNALGRHAVAALLNAAHPDVEYDYTTAEVIALFNAAAASGDKEVMNNQKDVFDFLNNQGCELN